jgi:hypothetical protein
MSWLEGPTWKSAIGSLAPAGSALWALLSLRLINPLRRFPSGASQQVGNLREPRHTNLQ